MSIGDNIKIIRKDRKLTQQAFADKINISRSYLSDIENNRKNPSSKTMESLAEKLNVSMFYLTTGKKALSDLSDEERVNALRGVKESLNKNTEKRQLNVKKDIEKILNSKLSFTETNYLSNALDYLKYSNDDDIIFLSALMSSLNIYKDVGKNGEIPQEKLLDFIEDETDDIKVFLKQHFHYKNEET